VWTPLAARCPRPAKTTVLSGLACGLSGATRFVVIHSLLIFPIWSRFLGRLPFALGAGVCIARCLTVGALA
jgi:hypothetical protein